MDKFWMEADKARTDEALERLDAVTDPAQLALIARTAPLEALRLAAVEKTDDKKTLVRLGKTARGETVRARAYERAGEHFLAGVERLKACRHYDDWETRWAALEGALTDSGVLRDIIDHARTHAVQELAVGKITDSALLAALARGHGHWGVRRAALKALGDEQAALAETARHGGNSLLRAEAIARLEDKTLLEALRGGEEDEQLRRAAKRRLHQLATGEEDYTFPVEREIPGLVSGEAYDDVCFLYDDAYIAVRRGGKLGFADRSGGLVIPCVYDGDRPLYETGSFFSGGVAAVEKNGLWGGIDRQGNTVVPFEYEWRFTFREGLAAARKNGLYGYIDTAGSTVIPFRYTGANDFSEGKAVVEKDGAECVINKEGGVLFALEGCFADYSPAYRGGFLRVHRRAGSEGESGCERKLYGLLDAHGKVAVPAEYDELDNSFGDEVRPAAKGGYWGAVDNTGKAVIPFVFDRVWHFDAAGVALVRRRGKRGCRYGFYSTAGQPAVPVKYQDMYYPEAGAAPARLGEKWGLVNLSGGTALPFEYDEMGIFYRRRAAVRSGDKWGCIDPEGRIVIPIVYDEVEGFEITNSTMVRQNGKYGCVGPNNEPLFPILYSDVCWPMEGVAIVRTDCDLMLVDGAGRVVYPHPIETYRALDEKRCWINVQGKWRMLRAPGPADA